MSFDVSAYAGMTLMGLRAAVGTYWHDPVSASELRMSFSSSDTSAPDEDYSWIVSSPYVVLPGSGTHSFDVLSSAVILGQYLWVTFWWEKDFLPPLAAYADFLVGLLYMEPGWTLDIRVTP
jgi:hypothetical protein